MCSSGRIRAGAVDLAGLEELPAIAGQAEALEELPAQCGRMRQDPDAIGGAPIEWGIAPRLAAEAARRWREGLRKRPPR